MSFRARVAKIRKTCHVLARGPWARLDQRVDLVTLSLPLPPAHIDNHTLPADVPVDSQAKLVAPKFASHLPIELVYFQAFVILVVVTSY